MKASLQGVQCVACLAWRDVALLALMSPRSSYCVSVSEIMTRRKQVLFGPRWWNVCCRQRARSHTVLGGLDWLPTHYKLITRHTKLIILT